MEMAYVNAGLLALLTTPVFLLLLSYVIIFEKLANTQRGYVKNTIRFFLFFNFIFFICAHLYLQMGSFTQFRVDIFLKYVFWEEIILLTFLIWFLIKLIFKKSIYFFDQLFYWLGIPLFSIKLFFASFSSLGPMIGQTFIEELIDLNVHQLYLNILSFSVALSLVFGLVLFLSKYIYKKYGREKWWEVLQIITAVLMLIDAGIIVYSYLAVF